MAAKIKELDNLLDLYTNAEIAEVEQTLLGLEGSN